MENQTISTRQQTIFDTKRMYRADKASKDSKVVIDKINGLYSVMCFKIMETLLEANVNSDFTAQLIFTNDSNHAQEN